VLTASCLVGASGIRPPSGKFTPPPPCLLSSRVDAAGAPGGELVHHDAGLNLLWKKCASSAPEEMGGDFADLCVQGLVDLSVELPNIGLIFNEPAERRHYELEFQGGMSSGNRRPLF
jgi:hypothetical protein